MVDLSMLDLLMTNKTREGSEENGRDSQSKRLGV